MRSISKCFETRSIDVNCLDHIETITPLSAQWCSVVVQLSIDSITLDLLSLLVAQLFHYHCDYSPFQTLLSDIVFTFYVTKTLIYITILIAN